MESLITYEIEEKHYQQSINEKYNGQLYRLYNALFNWHACLTSMKLSLSVTFWSFP